MAEKTSKRSYIDFKSLNETTTRNEDKSLLQGVSGIPDAKNMSSVNPSNILEDSRVSKRKTLSSKAGNASPFPRRRDLRLKEMKEKGEYKPSVVEKHGNKMENENTVVENEKTVLNVNSVEETVVPKKKLFSFINKESNDRRAETVEKASGWKQNFSLKKIVNNVSKKTAVIISSTLAVIITVLAALGFSLQQYLNSTVEVTQSLEYISSDTVFSEEELCEQYTTQELNCSVEWQMSDSVRRGGLIEQSVESGKRVRKGSDIVLHYSSGPTEATVPTLIGVDIVEAKQTLYDLGFNIGSITYVEEANTEENTVVETSVKSGTTLSNGSTIDVKVSSGTITVPDWTGKTKSYVESSAKSLGVTVSFVEEQSDQTPNIVLSQSATGEVSSSTEIVVTVSKEFDITQVAVPDVIGETAENAQAKLASAGLRSITTVTIQNCEVSSKQVTQVVPSVSTSVSSDTTITLIVSEPSDKCTVE